MPIKPLESYPKTKADKNVLVSKEEIIKQLQKLCDQFNLNVEIIERKTI